MKHQISKSNFSINWYDDQTKILYNDWQNCDDLEDDLFKQELLKYVELCEEYQPYGVIVSNMTYAIVPEVQEWITQNIDQPARNAGVTKFCFVVSEDFIAQLSLEQYADESKLQKKAIDVEIQFHTNIEEGENYINSFKR